MVYSLSRALLGAPGFLATVAPEKLSLPRNLTPASGCQNHTILLSASGALVRRTLRVHRSPPRERDDRDSPLSVGQDDKGYSPRIYCCQELFPKFGNIAGTAAVSRDAAAGRELFCHFSQHADDGLACDRWLAVSGFQR